MDVVTIIGFMAATCTTAPVILANAITLVLAFTILIFKIKLG